MKTYLLYGFINLHAVFPAFVYPVFVDDEDGSYYLEDGKDIIIHAFHKIDQDDLIGLYRFSMGVVDLKRQYKVGDKTVYAFMESPDKIIYGDEIRVTAFLAEYKEQTSDSLLIQEIEDFLRDIDLKSNTESMQTKETESSGKHADSLPMNVVRKFDETALSISRVYRDSGSYFQTLNDLGENSIFEEQLAELCPTVKLMSEEMFVLHIKSPSLRLTQQYRMLQKRHEDLVLEFQKNSNIYASVIMNEVISNEADDCISQDEFIMRMLQKKTWLFPKERLNAFCDRYDKSFPELIAQDEIYTASDEDIQNASNQLVRENRILRTLISYLQDVLEDRGISKTINSLDKKWD